MELDGCKAYQRDPMTITKSWPSIFARWPEGNISYHESAALSCITLHEKWNVASLRCRVKTFSYGCFFFLLLLLRSTFPIIK